MRGRKPVPTTLRILHGNPRRVPLPRHEPKPEGDQSDAPDWLNEGQRASWDYVMANAPPRLLKRIDRGTLVVWVVAEDLHRRAATAQCEQGLLAEAISGKKGRASMIASPYIRIINQQAMIILKAATELGFTPVSRPRVCAGPSVTGADLGNVSDAESGDRLSLQEFIARRPVQN